MGCAKIKAYKSLGRIIRKTGDVFVDERKLAESVLADQVILPSCMTDAQREEREVILNEAAHEKLIAEIASVRAAERLLNPCEFAKPAVIGMAVSAPCTTWSIHHFSCAPFPRFVSAINKTFEACYTNEDPKTNRLKKRVSKGSKQRSMKKE